MIIEAPNKMLIIFSLIIFYFSLLFQLGIWFCVVVDTFRYRCQFAMETYEDCAISFKEPEKNKNKTK